MRIIGHLRRLVAFEHTIFALPFAYAGMLLAGAVTGAAVTWQLAGWITLAMAGARTLAMVANRVIDARIDAANPRTAGREIPSGVVTRTQALLLGAVSAALMLLAVWQLDPVVRWLWPIPVAMFIAYPFMKRITWACHGFLGLTVGMAAPAAWVATAGTVGWVPVLAWLAVAAWVAGFDLIYATQDVEHDRRHGLHSLPARFGVAAALVTARILHVATVLGLAAVAVLAGAGPAHWAAVAVVAAVLTWEHTLVSADDLSRVDKAFFTANGYVGIAYLAGVAADTLLPG